MAFSDISLYTEQSSYEGLFSKDYNSEQLGAYFKKQQQNLHDAFDNSDIIIVGCGERRAAGNDQYSSAADVVREHLYQLYHWHTQLSICDVGNIVKGASIADTRAALLSVCDAVYKANKTIIIIGGSHDLTLQQYQAFKANEKLADITVLDMLIDLREQEKTSNQNFLFELLTEIPNYVRNFNLLGFQSFAVNPVILQTLDKLNFECTRLGKLCGDIEMAEPLIRASDIVSFDINTIKHSDAPCNINGSPNGLTGPEACTITEYAGLSSKCSSFGIYGYNEEDDVHSMSAKQISHMIWYFLNGRYYRASEAHPKNGLSAFEQYTVLLDHDTLLFFKNKNSGRWWVQLPSKEFFPCSARDYQKASGGELSPSLHKEFLRSS